MMKNDLKCVCGNLSDLSEDFLDGTLNDIEMSFNLREENDSFFMSFPQGMTFEVSTCWICGGLELGDTESENYQSRPNCNCELFNDWVKDKTIPIKFIYEFNEIQLVAYDGSDGEFPLIMDYCPYCIGKLPKTTRFIDS